MIAKFYKGPKHNKKMYLADYETRVVIAKPISMDDVWQPSSRLYDPTVRASRQGVYIRTNHTHPDGSVFFEFEGWD